MDLVVKIKKKLKDFYLDIFFEVNSDSFGMLGSSGSGKSMTLKCIAGLETPDEGQIILNGKVLYDSNKKINLKPQDRKIGYLFQNYALFPNMNVLDNIKIVLTDVDKKEKIKELIKLFNLDGLELLYPKQLSGGQQQRVALARIFAYEPDVLLLDEPFSALDSHLKEKLQTELFQYIKYYSKKIILVSHNREEIYKYTKDILIIDTGKSVLVGSTKETFKNPKIYKAAILTGCSNISKCEMLYENLVYAIDWGIKLNVLNNNDKIQYVGIHSGDIKICKKQDVDTVLCEIINMYEEINKFKIQIKVIDGNDTSYSLLIISIDKKEQINLKVKDKIYIKMPEEKLIILE